MVTRGGGNFSVMAASPRAFRMGPSESAETGGPCRAQERPGAGQEHGAGFNAREDQARAGVEMRFPPWCQPAVQAFFASAIEFCCLSTRGVLQAFSDVQVHPNGFGLGEILDGRRAVLATEAGIAHAAPRQPHIGIAIGVDPDGAGICFLRETLDASDVATPYPSREAVGSAVGDA